MPRDAGGADWVTQAAALKSSTKGKTLKKSKQPFPRPEDSSQSVWERMMAFGEETQRVERMMAFAEQTRQQEAANRMAAAFGGLPRYATGTPEERLASAFGALPVQGPVLYGAEAVRAQQAEQARLRRAQEPIYHLDRAGPGRPVPAVSRQNLLESRLRRYYAAGEAPPVAYDGGDYYPRYSSRGGGYSGGEEVKTWLNSLYAWNI
jgi:hypothetical protein